MNVLTCDHCLQTENEQNQYDWLKVQDGYGYQGDMCSWKCLRDFSQIQVDNPPPGMDDLPPPEEPAPKKAAKASEEWDDGADVD